MTQLIVNIEDISLVPLLEGILSKLKGVSVSPKTDGQINQSASGFDVPYNDEKSLIKEKRRKAIEDLKKMKFDSSLIDMEDERTKYIMSK